METMRFASVLAASVLSFSCARSAAERQMDDLREEMSKGSADMPTPRMTSQEGLAKKGAAEIPLPKLRVIHLSPDDPPEAQSPRGARDEEAEPADGWIRETGNPRTVRRSKAAGSPEVASGRKAGEPLYEEGARLLSEGKYQEAEERLAAFLVQFPDHPRAEDAMTLRADAFLSQGDSERAIQEYEGVLSRFRKGTRSPDCLLSLARAHEALGRKDAAKGYVSRLLREYPNSAAAKKVPKNHP